MNTEKKANTIKARAEKLTAEILAKFDGHEIKSIDLDIRQGVYPELKVGEILISARREWIEGFFTITTGMIDDEGTAAQLFCRDYRFIAIGERGGCTLVNAMSQKESKGLHHAVWGRTDRHKK